MAAGFLAAMSEKGQKETWRSQTVMSALPPKADIHELGRMTPGLSDWLPGAIIA
jgi:hypothetical protein